MRELRGKRKAYRSIINQVRRYYRTIEKSKCLVIRKIGRRRKRVTEVTKRKILDIFKENKMLWRKVKSNREDKEQKYPFKLMRR